MTFPNLINSISVEIVQIDEDETVYNNRKRYPANRIKRETSFKIDAQIVFLEQDYVESAKAAPEIRNLSGAIKNTSGYIIVRCADLDAMLKVLSDSDKIISYGDVICEYYLVGKKDSAHYSNSGNTTLQKWFFVDRK